MTKKKFFTPAQIILVRNKIYGLTVDDLLSRGFIDVEEVLDADTPPTYSVILEDCGERKIWCIRQVRDFTGIGLREAKYLVDTVPSAVVTGQTAAEAERIASHFRDGEGVIARIRAERS